MALVSTKRINEVCGHFFTEIECPAFHEPVVAWETADEGVHALQAGQFEVAGHACLPGQL